MKRLFLLFLSISIANISFSQSALPLKPIWNVGDKKELEIKSAVQTGDITTQEQLGEQYVEVSTAIINVVREDEDSYYLEIDCENSIYKQLNALAIELDFKLKGEKRLLLQVRVDKKSGKATLTNAAALLKSTSKTANNGIKKFKEVPGMAIVFDSYIKPLMDYYNSENSITDILKTEFGFLEMPYIKDLSFKDTIAYKEVVDNPYDVGKKITVTANVYPLKQGANLETLVINSANAMDADAIMQTMDKLLTSVMMYTGLNPAEMDSAKRKAAMDVDINDSSELIYNTATGWPERYTRTMDMQMKEETRVSTKAIRTVIVK